MRENADLLCWDLNDVWPYLHYFFANLYEDEKAQPFLSEYRAIYVDSPNPAYAKYRTFAGPEAQSLVVARTCERMLREAEEGDLGVDHDIVLTDELNAFAPQGTMPTPSVRKVIQRISTQGRYAGISLFGAAPKLSKIDELTPLQRRHPRPRCHRRRRVGIRSVWADAVRPGGADRHLERGYMALTHYSLRAPLIVRSHVRPGGPAGRKGNKKKSKPRVTDALGLSPRQYARLTEGVPPEGAG